MSFEDEMKLLVYRYLDRHESEPEDRGAAATPESIRLSGRRTAAARTRADGR